jgi:broad specificity phosphatase PhoE
MSTLLLVRHGKASAFAQDYDQLSPVGAEQSRLLAEHWAGADATSAVVFDAVFVGPRKRQAQTHDAVRAVYAERGLAWPEPVVLSELDEHDGFNVVFRALPDLAAADAVLAALVEKMSRGERPTNEDALEAFRRVVRRWVRGEVDHPDVEPWRVFRARVVAALGKMGAVGKKKKIVAFTSAGAIAAAVGHALGVTDDEKVLELSWALFNGSVTELNFSSTGFGLLRFNATHHLAGDLVTSV